MSDGISDMMNSEHILCAAVWFKDGVRHEHQPINIDSGFVVCGRRHHNCFITASILKGENFRTSEYGKNVQGFITSLDRFVDRKEASLIAYARGQISMERSDGVLFSEDLY